MGLWDVQFVAYHFLFVNFVFCVDSKLKTITEFKSTNLYSL